MHRNDHPLAARLEAMLDQYCAAMNRWTSGDPRSSTTLEADACFAALRLQQRVRWPGGAGLVDEVGQRAQDLVAIGNLRGRASPACREAAGSLDRAVSQLRMGIASIGVLEVSA